MSDERIFGTDGIRGPYGHGWLSDDGASAIGWALGRVLAREDARGDLPRVALLGHDGRRSGPALESALARGLAATGFAARSAGLITTPGLALLTRLGEFGAGVMVSASHNPAGDNGIKILSAQGEKLSDETELAIEAELRADPQAAREGAPPERDPALERQYLEYLCKHAGEGLDLHGLSLVVDCANGGASRIAPRVLARLGAEAYTIAAEPDGTNINQQCGSTHPAALQHEVLARGADLGIALDGDGDRCILVDERGELVHGDAILTLLALHEAERGTWSDSRLVATVMSNRGLHRALRQVGVGVVTVGVGDRRVVEALRRESLHLGGEQSGHIVFGSDNHYIGDGIYTALRVLRVLRESGRPLSALAAPYQPLPQVLQNVQVAQKPDLARIPSVADAVTRCEAELGEYGRVLLRYSGTEPLARVMVEGVDPERVRTLANELCELIQREIGA